MTKRRNLNIFLCLIFYFVFGAMMIYGTFNDLEIDKALFNYTNKFGMFMEYYGMYPQSCIQLFAYSTLIVCYRPIDEAFAIAQRLVPIFDWLKNNKITYKILFILYHIMYGAFFYGAFQGSNEMLNFILRSTLGGNIQELNEGKAWGLIAWIALRLVVLAVVIFLLSRVKKHKALIEFMAIAGLAIYYGEDIINILKNHFHRIRFREMMAYSHGYINEDGYSDIGSHILPQAWVNDTDFSAFDRWYHVGNDMGRYSSPSSFPSGHTSAASFSLLIYPLFAKSKSLSKYTSLAFLVGAGYVFMMGISRLIRGAHYMTDIAGAGLIMMTMMLVFIGVMNIIYKKAFDKKECYFD